MIKYVHRTFFFFVSSFCFWRLWWSAKRSIPLPFSFFLYKYCIQDCLLFLIFFQGFFTVSSSVFPSLSSSVVSVGLVLQPLVCFTWREGEEGRRRKKRQNKHSIREKRMEMTMREQHSRTILSTQHSYMECVSYVAFETRVMNEEKNINIPFPLKRTSVNFLFNFVSVSPSFLFVLHLLLSLSFFVEVCTRFCTEGKRSREKEKYRPRTHPSPLACRAEFFLLFFTCLSLREQKENLFMASSWHLLTSFSLLFPLNSKTFQTCNRGRRSWYLSFSHYVEQETVTYFSPLFMAIISIIISYRQSSLPHSFFDFQSTQFCRTKELWVRGEWEEGRKGTKNVSCMFLTWLCFLTSFFFFLLLVPFPSPCSFSFFLTPLLFVRLSFLSLHPVFSWYSLCLYRFFDLHGNWGKEKEEAVKERYSWKSCDSISLLFFSVMPDAPTLFYRSMPGFESFLWQSLKIKWSSQESAKSQSRVSRDESLNLMQCFMHSMHVCLGQFWVQEQQWCWWRWSMKEKCLWFSQRNVCNTRRREAGNVGIVLREGEEKEKMTEGISGIKKRDQEEGGMIPFLFFSLPHFRPHSLPSSPSSLPVFDHKLMERVSKTGRDRQFDSGETKGKRSESMTTIFVLSFDNNSLQPEKSLPPYSFFFKRETLHALPGFMNQWETCSSFVSTQMNNDFQN